MSRTAIGDFAITIYEHYEQFNAYVRTHVRTELQVCACFFLSTMSNKSFVLRAPCPLRPTKRSSSSSSTTVGDRLDDTGL